MACFKFDQMPPVVFSRWTKHPLRFRQKELQRLYQEYNNRPHSFLSVAIKGSYIDLESFHENMGILGVQSTQPFADRLFASFDLDADGLVMSSVTVDQPAGFPLGDGHTSLRGVSKQGNAVVSDDMQQGRAYYPNRLSAVHAQLSISMVYPHEPRYEYALPLKQHRRCSYAANGT